MISGRLCSALIDLSNMAFLIFLPFFSFVLRFTWTCFPLSIQVLIPWSVPTVIYLGAKQQRLISHMSDFIPRRPLSIMTSQAFLSKFAFVFHWGTFHSKSSLAATDMVAFLTLCGRCHLVLAQAPRWVFSFTLFQVKY